MRLNGSLRMRLGGGPGNEAEWQPKNEAGWGTWE